MATDLDTERGIVRVPTGTWTIDHAHPSVEFRISSARRSENSLMLPPP